MKENLFRKLTEYSGSDIYPFCMPGHKQRFPAEGAGDPYRMDITEMEGFDDLHDPKGILAGIMQEAQEIYHCPHVFLSVNGSTACNLAAIRTVPEGGPLLAASNCHRSVKNGAAICARDVLWMDPPVLPEGVAGGISPEMIEEAFAKEPEIRGVILTSPTYEGLLSDVEAIAGAVHRHGALLIVDEAHGAHLPYSDRLPQSALSKGADMVIQSMHKTMGSLNQTAWLFVNREELADAAWENLRMFMTTSPSYLLMASMQEAMERAASTEGRRQMNTYLDLLLRYREAFAGLKNISFIDKSIVGRYNVYDLDPTKLVFLFREAAGDEIMARLVNEYHLQLERCGAHYVVALTSMYDTEEGFARLLAAMKEIDG